MMNKRQLGAGIAILTCIVLAVFAFNRFGPKAGVKSVHSWGKSRVPESAKVTIVEYSDFQCPACAASQAVLKELLKNYPGQIHLVFRHFPLPMHAWSPLAHQAAECAERSGKFWDFQDKMFETQKEWSGPANPLEKFLGFSKSLGLNLDEFAACLNDPKIADRIKEERRRGEDLKISSTPTFFINGERVVGPVDLKMKGEALIRSILGLAPKPVPPAPVSPPAPPAAPVPAVIPAKSKP